MYAFSLLMFPLAVPALLAWRRPESGNSYRMAIRGAILALPALLAWHLLGFAHQPAWGSVLLAGSFFLRYFFLPFALMWALYAFAGGLTDLRRGSGYTGCMLFALGYLSVFNVAHVVNLWTEAYVAFAVVLPVLRLSAALAVPALLEEAARDGMPDGLKWIAAAAGLTLAQALGLALFFLRVEWLGLILSAGTAALGAFVGLRRLAREPGR
ncbi:MAG: hypothetical protein JW923_05060 [Spirochaetales bacterium]|nr:hypothetical protein [Spirochaetales bacterium]